MKKHLLALAALATVSGVAFAQSNVTVYGIIDTAVFTTNNSTDGKSQTSLQSGTWMPSLFGFTGSEDLGGGLKANFDLQMDLDSTTGAGGGSTLFNRNASVGLSGNFGRIDLGKQLDNFFLQGVSNSVVFMHANTLAYHGLTYSRSNGNSQTAGVFNDKMVAYTTPSINGLTVKAQYTVTGGAGDSDSKEMKNAIATYSVNGVNLSAGYALVSNAYNAATGTTAGPDLKKTLLGAKTKIGQVDLAVQYQSYKQSSSTVDARAFEAGVGYNFSPALLVAVNFERFDDKVANTNPQIVSLKGKYSLSKRTAVYGIAAQHNKEAGAFGQAYGAATGVATKTATNYAVGVTHSF